MRPVPMHARHRSKESASRPDRRFSSPEAVVEHPHLTREEKTDILQRWKYDATQLEVAEEENMGGGEPSMLEQVLKSLAVLGVETHLEHSPPTKQGTN